MLHVTRHSSYHLYIIHVHSKYNNNIKMYRTMEKSMNR